MCKKFISLIILMCFLSITFSSCSDISKKEAIATNNSSDISANNVNNKEKIMLIIDAIRSNKEVFYGKYNMYTEKMNNDAYKSLGYNLLQGITPEIKDKNGKQPGINRKDTGSGLGIVYLWTDGNPSAQHIDVAGSQAPIYITYDMGRKVNVEIITFSGMQQGTQKYLITEYQIYLSNSRETLYNEENCIINYKNVENSKRDHMFTLRDKPEARYFGIKVINPNSTDKTIRISRIGVFNNAVSEQMTFLTQKFGRSVLDGLIAVYDRKENSGRQDSDQQENSDKMGYSGKLEFLTDGKVFSDDNITINASEKPVRFTFRLPGPTDISRVVLCGKLDSAKYYIYLSDKNDETDLFNKKNRVCDSSDAIVKDTGHDGYELMMCDIKGSKITNLVGLEFTAGTDIKIDEIAAYDYKANIKIDTKQVINNDFVGIGENVIPTALMPESLEAGYNEAYWEIEAKRFKAMKLSLVRVWFQVDWFETQKGVYNFETEKMKAFYKYLDLFKETGTEVLLNFSWKAGNSIQSWYSIPGVARARESAPYDLDAYAKSCSALIKELVQNRGYSNIKYLTFYNEPDAEFDVTDAYNKKEYFYEMVRKVDKRLKEDGLRDIIKLVGAEETTNAQWLSDIVSNLGDCLDIFTVHIYRMNYDKLVKRFKEELRITNGKPLFMTEFGDEDIFKSWYLNNAGYIIAAANNGWSAAVHWMLNGVVLTDTKAVLDSGTMFSWTGFHQKKVNLDGVNYPFYELGLLSNYIPAHSQVIVSSSDSEYVRTAVFQTGSSDYTVVVETESMTDEYNINIDFGTKINKKFNKFLLNNSIMKDANAIIPRCLKQFNVDRTLSDVVGKGYSLIVYTTLPPTTQVKMDKVLVQINVGSSVQLNAEVIDNTGGVEWSVLYGPGEIDKKGLYTAPENAKGKTAVVKATSKKDPDAYGCTLIEIR
jgi:hypothetical protein